MICRFALNTSFFDPDLGLYSLDKFGVDPDSITKDKKFDPNFKIGILYQRACFNCRPQMPHQSLCKNCKFAMTDEIMDWIAIRDIIEEHRIICKKATSFLISERQKALLIENA